ncbi:MAG TPA: hypothetical protein PLD99_01335, partial [Parcubacteria group bacterium]|nr:hypothetical protein [Parcubacteria group bacterium]
MADKKEAPKTDPVVEVGFIILVLIFLWVIWSTILNYLLVSRFGSYSTMWEAVATWFIRYIYPIIILLGLVATILAIMSMVRNMSKLKALKEAEKKIFGSDPDGVLVKEVVAPLNPKWEKAMSHLNSTNASEWRLAIIEADIMLDDMLRAQGHHGDSIGEMLKGIERSDMLTLDFAWEAHKIRNEVVHSGSTYELNEREARRVMSLFEAVFREFKMI